MKIPFVDLKRQNNLFMEELQKAVNNVIEKGVFILGEEVELFEQEFADYCDSKHCLGVSSGTDALHLALLASGIKSGDEVITVSNSFISTALAITWCGATPVFIDCREDDLLIDYNLIESKITSRTKVILVVHLYGQLCDMKEILRIAGKNGLKVIEDACQAHGAEDMCGRKAGSLGDVSAFSFYPSKNLGCWGEGGAVVTNNDDIYEKVCLLRNYGQKKKYFHKIKGYNNRLDTLQAAVLRVKLCYLDQLNSSRRDVAGKYDRLLDRENGIILPKVKHPKGHVFHLYVVRIKDRDRIQAELKKTNIETSIHYPIPIHKEEAFREFNTECFSNIERFADEILSLPMFPGMTDDELYYVSLMINKFNKKYNA